MEPLLVLINEAAKALNLGRTSIYELIKQYKLESRKMGRRHMVTTASIRRLADGEE